MVTAYRVERVGECDGPLASDPPDIEAPTTLEESKELAGELPYPTDVSYASFKVTIYTIFGMPFGEVSLGCDERR